MNPSSSTIIALLAEQLQLSSNSLKSLYSVVFGAILCLLMLWQVSYRDAAGPNGAGLRIVDQGQWWDVFNLQPKLKFYLDGRRGLDNAYEKACGKPFRMVGIGALVTILPPEYADEIRNDKNLDFSKVVSKFFSSNLPGFEGFRSGLNDLPVVLDMCKYKLTRELAAVLEPLPEECALAVEDILDIPDHEEWRTVAIKGQLNLLVARISARVFLGPELCRDPAWLKIAISHIMTGSMAALSLRMFPSFLRPFVTWALPPCRSLRSQVQQARDLIRPVIERRKQEKAAAVLRGDRPVQYNDGIEWADIYANGRAFDRVDLQLGLSIAAVHNTTDLLAQVVYDLASNPELVERLRSEAIQVLGQGGWSKTSLYNLKLLDSVIKESQRIKPILTVAMPREATADITLADGTFLPRGTILAVSTQKHWHPDVYPEPEKFVGDRFLKMRQIPGRENTSQLVTTGPAHLGFGHGSHACPGRFLAAAEIKIIMVHLILGYEWTTIDGREPSIRVLGITLDSDPSAKIRIRRRSDR